VSDGPTDLGPVVILCGGRGTRLQEHTRSIPKPLVEIGGKPIVWHVIQVYAAQGFTDFILCTGYLGEMVGEFAAAEPWPAGVRVRCVDTGEETQTGGRIRRVGDLVSGGPFCVTYADGVADIDLHALLAFHRRHDGIATMTVVRPELQFGVTEIDDEGLVGGFHEKPRSDHWINGGFFCFEPEFLEYLGDDDAVVLEREPLERVADAAKLRGYRHHGFWDCMDTYKDAVLLNDLWARNEAPWRVW
jgi:glucose-1-phosphate cytidylyltransferase